MLDSCTASCGWIALAISCLGFGSFAVPIKSSEAKRVDVDPLVFHTYKVLMCFVTSFIVLPLGENLYFTPWGILSSVFWVPASIATVYAVKNAGLAITHGISCTGIVLVSFTWGIFIFQERVQSKINACIAILLVVSGLWGMSLYSSPEYEDDAEEEYHDKVPTPDLAINNTMSSSSLTLSIQSDGTYECSSKPLQLEDEMNYHYGSVDITKSSTSTSIVYAWNESKGEKIPTVSFKLSNEKSAVWPRKDWFSRRTLGLMAAVFNGIWGGSIFVPMHYAPVQCRGIGYAISFSIGAIILTVFVWIALYAYLYFFRAQMSFERAYQELPSFHFRSLWLPGSLFGVLWSIANISSMISVQTLGEGVGFSIPQANMLISGLWGIFYFEEVKSFETRMKWFTAAIVTIGGILLLSQEHQI